MITTVADTQIWIRYQKKEPENPIILDQDHSLMAMSNSSHILAMPWLTMFDPVRKLPGNY